MDDRIERFVRRAIDDEVASGYKLVQRVPSTHTWKILDYVAALDVTERSALFDDFAANGAFLLQPDREAALHAHRAARPSYARFVDALPRMGDWKYADVRLLRGILGDVRGKRPSPEFAGVPSDVLQRAEGIQPTNAAAIRREVKARFAGRFAAKAEKRPGGVWVYAGRTQDRTFQVQIDYAGMGDQLRYSLSFDDMRRGLRARRLSYEGLTGFGLARWDFVTADNLASSIDLLVELIEWLVAMPDKMSTLDS